MKSLNTRTFALLLIACLSLGAASCSTTNPRQLNTGEVAAETRLAPINGNSFAKDVADGTLGTVGTAMGAGAKVLVSALYFVPSPYRGEMGPPPWETW
ncbi:MAG: hypothetical protein ACR2RV_13420 [Verrucomicrobiales bacterium]